MTQDEMINKVQEMYEYAKDIGSQMDDTYDDIAAMAQVMEWVRNDEDKEFRTFVAHMHNNNPENS